MYLVLLFFVCALLCKCKNTCVCDLYAVKLVLKYCIYVSDIVLHSCSVSSYAQATAARASEEIS